MVRDLAGEVPGVVVHDEGLSGLHGVREGEENGFPRLLVTQVPSTVVEEQIDAHRQTRDQAPSTLARGELLPPGCGGVQEPHRDTVGHLGRDGGLVVGQRRGLRR